MQADLHYGLSYVLARLAGFEKGDATTIAWSCQYVDDATNGGVIEFDNGAKYDRISSAHLTRDFIHNLEDIQNHRTWIPFHFLPGNASQQHHKHEQIPFINKIIYEYHWSIKCL